MKPLALTLFCTLFLLLTPRAQAAHTDTLAVYSPGMDKHISVLVIRPDRAAEAPRCPVLYLLHGHGGNFKSWSIIQPSLPQTADREGLIIVCPDGADSWYWDSPVIKSSRYETFVAKELVHHIDSLYPTCPDRSHRAIAGLSMGGHGALWLAIRHKDVFGACGSMSGGLDIRPFPDSWNMKKYLGERSRHPEVWDEHTVINQLGKIENGDLAIIIDCGLGDFFLEVNKAVHQALLARKIDHDFILRPGQHNVSYWNNAIDYQILFFLKFFRRTPVS